MDGYFAVVRFNDTLTFDFDDASDFDSHHYAFHVSDREFDAILARVRARGLPYGAAFTSMIRQAMCSSC